MLLFNAFFLLPRFYEKLVRNPLAQDFFGEHAFEVQTFSRNANLSFFPFQELKSTFANSCCNTPSHLECKCQFTNRVWRYPVRKVKVITLDGRKLSLTCINYICIYSNDLCSFFRHFLRHLIFSISLCHKLSQSTPYE